MLSNPYKDLLIWHLVNISVGQATGDKLEGQKSVQHQSGDAFHSPIAATPLAVLRSCESLKAKLTLLDLFSGCGGMSTGLSLGAKLSSVNLVTRWAVDFQKSATESVKLNHPEAQK